MRYRISHELIGNRASGRRLGIGDSGEVSDKLLEVGQRMTYKCCHDELNRYSGKYTDFVNECM